MAERFDHFMARANEAYYARRDFWSDFTTGPEITQMFGELLGAWSQIVWQMLGAPDGILLAEAGPGRGTLMADALRVWDAPSVHFIETSPRLRALQAAKVARATWHDSLDTLPDGPLILLANEFLDALPVRQFVRRAEGWRERFVEHGTYVEQDTNYPLPDDPVGAVRELGEAGQEFCAKLAARGGIGLFIDYGPMHSAPGESVQALRDGKAGDVLAEPGLADLTAHVDFAAIARRVHVQGPVKQNAFLTALGLFQRADALARRHPERASALRAATQRLTAPEAMGSLFKCLLVCPEHFPPAPGFETA